MAQLFFDYVHMHAALHHPRRGCMPQIVNSDIRKSGLPEDALKGVVQCRSLQRSAIDRPYRLAAPQVQRQLP